jgi:hypothetical protein
VISAAGAREASRPALALRPWLRRRMPSRYRLTVKFDREALTAASNVTSDRVALAERNRRLLLFRLSLALWSAVEHAARPASIHPLPSGGLRAVAQIAPARVPVLMPIRKNAQCADACADRLACLSALRDITMPPKSSAPFRCASTNGRGAAPWQAPASYSRERVGNVPHVSLLVGAGVFQARELGGTAPVEVFEVGSRVIRHFPVATTAVDNTFESPSNRGRSATPNRPRE